jgi:hypothetical protein
MATSAQLRVFCATKPAHRQGVGYQEKLIAMKAKWVVRLGQSEWARHTNSPNVDAALRLIGSVQHGARQGALAVDGNGNYFQVNGEYIAPLNKRHVGKAVSAAQMRAPSQHTPRRPPSAAPVVTVRRKRQLDPGL